MQNQTGFLSELDLIINKIIELFLKDNILCKLIKYNTQDILSESNFDTNELLFDKVFPLPKMPTAETEKSTNVNIYVWNVKPWQDNNSFNRVQIAIDIMSDINIWKTEIGLRPYMIANRIDTILNNTYMKELSLQKCRMIDMQYKVYSDYISGFRLLYEFTNNGNLKSR